MNWFQRLALLAMTIGFFWAASLFIEAGVQCGRGERMTLVAQGIIGIAFCTAEGGIESMQQLRLPSVR